MIIHLDMDAFFASVEQLDNPQYAGKPLIIGGGDRGVVATASYEARVFGIHSAMPIAHARKLCPEAIFIHGNYGRYSQVSRNIMQRLRAISPVIQKASIDEAYVDGADPIKNAGGYLEAAQLVKRTVWEASGGLTCSIGMAPVKFLAKICSDQQKPDGITILKPEDMQAFLCKLDIARLPGVGRHMAASLKVFGITTVAQARKLSREFLEARYGKFGLVLYDRCRGIDPRQVCENPPAKSEGCERTFNENIRDRVILNNILWKQAQKIAQSLAKNRQAGRTVTLKIKFADFKQITRSRTLEFRINSASLIFRVASSLLLETRLTQPCRLIGISISGFEPRPEQLSLPGIERMI